MQFDRAQEIAAAHAGACLEDLAADAETYTEAQLTAALAEIRTTFAEAIQAIRDNKRSKRNG